MATRGALLAHLSMTLVLSNKYLLKLHVSGHLGDHDAVWLQTVVCEHGDVVVFASMLKHCNLGVVPGVGKRIVLFRFPTPDVRHQWVAEGRVNDDPLPGAKDELAPRPWGDRPLPAPSRIPHWGQFFAFAPRLQGTVRLHCMRQFEVKLAPMGESDLGCLYHPLLLWCPAAHADDPMGLFSVHEGDVLWASRLAWVELGDTNRQQTHLLQQCRAPAMGPCPRRKPWSWA